MNMKTYLYTVAILAVLALAWACNDNAEPSRTSIVAGVTDEASFFSDLAEPDTMINDGIHSTTMALDIDGDGTDDLLIVSAMDTIYDMNNNPERALKQLHISAAQSNTDQIRVAATGPLTSRMYGRGQVISRNETLWVNLDSDAFILAGSDQDLTTGQSVIIGNWNGANREFLGLLLQKGGSELLAWVELSVISFDNYVYFNHCSYNLD